FNEKQVVFETVHEGKKLAMIQYKLGKQDVVEVYADYIQAQHIAAQIKELFTEKVFAGFGVYNTLRTKEGLNYAELAKTCQGKCFQAFYQKFPERFNPTKPYFIGQKKVVEIVEKLEPVGNEFNWTEKEGEPKKSCLYDEHLKLKGRMVPFAGWKMPVMYTSILDEHKKVREAAGLFDVSHMGVFEFEGEDAEQYLDIVTTNFVKRLRPGNSHYSYIFDANADCIDDIMVYRLGAQKFQMVVNAANEDKDWDWFTGVREGRYLLDNARPWVKIPDRLAIRNLKTDESLGDKRKIDIALQGRNSLAILRSMMKNSEDKQKLEWLPKTDFIDVELAGIPVTVARTGYTGAPVGFELYFHPDAAPEIWNTILSRADTYPVYPVGLGARDSTRTEAGFPLYGHELSGTHNIFPTEAGYGSFVKRHKPFFIGRAPFLAKEDKRENELIRFKVEKRGISTIHPGAPVLNKKGQCIGYVTSAALIGTKQMGLAYVKKRNLKAGTSISIIIPPRKGAKPVNPVELKPGESMILPEPARILERFPTDEELLENLDN
ncbi:MAG: glycine cleavage system aminomethyltransferase GcvT, partial [Planctomycetes bacterium]|nr:glycine cleavage system aminomethyltransferase GcvT [Planctomycetota bacterium]